MKLYIYIYIYIIIACTLVLQILKKLTCRTRCFLAPHQKITNSHKTKSKLLTSHTTSQRERERERERMSREEKVVCVTGASGYIAAWLVKLLLQRGYTVKATVRDTSQCFLSLSLSLQFISTCYYVLKIQALYCVSISKFILSDFIFWI